MTETVPDRIHVRWGKSGDIRVTYMEERFWPPDAEAEYVLATALEAAQARIAELEAEKREAALQYLADAGQLSDALATARREALEEAAKVVDSLAKDFRVNAAACVETHPEFAEDRIEHAEDVEEAANKIRALMENPND